MSYLFTAAANLTVTPAQPFPLDSTQVIWTSGEITQGATFKAVTATILYHAIVPDGVVTTPLGVRLALIIQEKQDDNSWVEIGRQNTAITLKTQGTKRTIVVSPVHANEEEGVDQFITGLTDSEFANIKSRFGGSAEGILRLRLEVRDLPTNSPNPNQNPFTSVTFTITGKRYDPN